MDKSSSLNYQNALGARFSVRILTKSYRTLLVLIGLLLMVQVVLVIMWASTCTEIYGISLHNRVFGTDSFTCPIPGVEWLYER